MTDLFADDGNPVVAQGREQGIVIRLSRTASGTRTYTLGATLGPDDVPEAVVDALFAIEALVAERMEQPVRPPRESMVGQLRRSVLMEKLSKAKEGEWFTTNELVGKGEHRSQVVTDLKALTAEGLVEYQRGRGGNYPSRYRLAQKEGKR